MKAILIDPFSQTIRPVEISEKNFLRDAYSFINCDCITSAGELQNGDTAYVDDNGLLIGPTHFFRWAGYPEPLAGRGILCGSNREGESVDVKSTVEEIAANVKFYTRLGTRLFQIPCN